MLDATPELAGWKVSVSLTEGSGSDLERPEHEDLDTEAERLLPSGDEIASRLIHEIQHEQSVYQAAGMFQALETEDLSTENLDGLSAAERASALRRASALAGCLMHAAIIVIDELIDDIVSLRARADLADEPDTVSPLFAQRLLVAMVDVTGRLTKGWEPLASVAQELSLRLLLNQVEIVAEAAGVALDDDWRGHLEDILFEDIDHELLYDPAHDGIEDDPESQPPGWLRCGSRTGSSRSTTRGQCPPTHCRRSRQQARSRNRAARGFVREPRSEPLIGPGSPACCPQRAMAAPVPTSLPVPRPGRMTGSANVRL